MTHKPFVSQSWKTDNSKTVLSGLELGFSCCFLQTKKKLLSNLQVKVLSFLERNVNAELTDDVMMMMIKSNDI